MKENRQNQNLVRKIAIIGLFTALAIVLSMIKIPIMGVSITLVLPVVIIGAALCGPWVGAWLTVIPNVIAFGEAGIFMTESPAGCIVTLLLKGILAGLAAGFVYRFLSKKHPMGAVVCASVVTPTVNTAVFVLGTYLFIWDELVKLAGEKGIGIGMLLFGLAIFNYIIELVLNLVLCPTIMRIINMISKRKA